MDQLVAEIDALPTSPQRHSFAPIALIVKDFATCMVTKFGSEAVSTVMTAKSIHADVIKFVTTGPLGVDGFGRYVTGVFWTIILSKRI